MARLFLLLNLFAAVGIAAPPEFEFRERTSTGGETLKYVAYGPQNLEPGKTYPFLLFLHGSCAVCVTHQRILRESNLQLWHDYDRNAQREPTFLVAPAGGRGGWTNEARSAAVLELVDELIAEFPIDRQRIYIQGFSMGGAGTWHFLQERPGFFAAANPQAIGGGVVDAEKVKDTPIWATVGSDDAAQRVDQLTANISRIRLANGDPRGASTHVTAVNPRFTIFPATGHGGAQGGTQRIPGFVDWMYSQINDGNTPPVVRFIRPTPAIGAYRTSVSAIVSAEDADGTIAQVEFLLAGTVVHTATEAPYEYSYDDLSPGTHLLRARATDNDGKSRTAEARIEVAEQ
jgi:pimeloyl-ACP methyl ester carboxylesterase